MFRNVTFYRFPRAFAESLIGPGLIELEDALAASPAKPCGAFELQSRGWVSPYGDDSTALFQQSGDCILLALGGEDKVIPPAAVKAEVRRRVAEREQRDGQKVARRTVAAIKDDVMSELLPRALTKPYRLSGYIDLQERFLAVDTSSRKAADEFVAKLRETLGIFPAVPLSCTNPLKLTVDGFYNSYGTIHFPLDFLIGEELWLSEGENGLSVRASGFILDDGMSIKNRYGHGYPMQCTRIALTYADRLSFTFGDDLVIRKLKFLEAAVDSLDKYDSDDVRAEVDARFALLSGEVRALFRALDSAFGFADAE